MEPFWLDADEIIRTNAAVVEQTGEPFAILNAGALQSALGRAQAAYVYGDVVDLAELASLYLFGIAQSHPFLQGNKRTGFFAALMFLEVNGLTLSDDADEVLGPLIVDALADASVRDNFPAVLRGFVVPLA